MHLHTHLSLCVYVYNSSIAFIISSSGFAAYLLAYYLIITSKATTNRHTYALTRMFVSMFFFISIVYMFVCMTSM